MADTSSIFGNYKLCKECGRPLSHSYEDECCPACLERQLFNDVKEYIRMNTVNEYDVSAHFQIPLKQVKYWIREGRIEYKTDNPEANMSALHCEVCGAPISYGTMCPNCMRTAGAGKGFSVSAKKNDSDNNKMRFIDNKNG